jgi:hypothetical protein
MTDSHHTICPLLAPLPMTPRHPKLDRCNIRVKILRRVSGKVQQYLEGMEFWPLRSGVPSSVRKLPNRVTSRELWFGSATARDWDCSASPQSKKFYGVVGFENRSNADSEGGYLRNFIRTGRSAKWAPSLRLKSGPNENPSISAEFSALLPLGLAFDNGDVTVNRDFGKSLHCGAGLWPFHLQPVDLRPATNA